MSAYPRANGCHPYQIGAAGAIKRGYGKITIVALNNLAAAAAGRI